MDLERARGLVSSSDVTIIGAGVAGLVTGLLLSQRGIRSTILERYADPRLPGRRSAQSINLALSHRGLRTLDLIGTLDMLRDRMVPMYGRMVHGPATDSFQPYDAPTESAIYSVRRDEIVDVLLRRLADSNNVQICYQCACSAIDLRRKTLVLEDPAGGRKLRTSFQTLIGADGCHSIVRDAIICETGGADAIEVLDHGFMEAELRAPIAAQLSGEKQALHIWPGGDFMLIALPNPNGTFTATLFMPRFGTESFEALAKGSVADVLDRYLPRHPELAPALVDTLGRQPVGRLFTVSATPWHCEGVALIIGDASHAMTPFFGQGMNCALEDCRLLMTSLDTTGCDWAGVFHAFERSRKKDADAISSLSMNNYVEMRRSVIETHYLRKREISQALRLRHPERFLPLYPMVAFTSIPYSEALCRHRIQDGIVERLCAESDPVDMALADRLIAEHLSPLPAVVGLPGSLQVGAGA